MLKKSLKEYKPRYVTRDDYFYVKGIRLEYELVKTDDMEHDPERFLRGVEDECINYLTMNYDFCEDLITSDNIVFFQLGVIEQAYQKIKMGSNAEMSISAKGYFRNGGFMNMRY